MATYHFDQTISGSLASDVHADVALAGLDNMHLTTTVAGRLDNSSDVTLHSESKVATTSSVEVAPLTTSSSVDLAPVAVDTCIRVELGSLPATELTTPWEQRLGLSVLGVELVAWVLCGESTTTLRPARREPVVVGSLASTAPSCSCGHQGDQHQQCDCRRPSDHGPGNRADRHEPGLEIRLGP